MKKKHRDIVVDGVQYGWTTESYYRLNIWKDKKVIAKYIIGEHHEAITPKLVAALIKDPNALEWINAHPCPFCKALVEDGDAYVCEHKENCWIRKTGTPVSVIPRDLIDIWNNRELH